jgi:ribose transport system ATP-binding protein
MSHRIVVMSEGRITGELTAAEATQESVMHYATLRPDESLEDAEELARDEHSPVSIDSVQKAGEQ